MMPSVDNRKLRVFLCHTSQDKPIVRELYQRLLAEGWIDPWLDEENLLPGQDWDMEIEKAVELADTVIVCLSKKAIGKEGYIQREIKFALDIALEKPEGSIFIIPLRLDECETPRRLRSWQYVDYFPSDRKKWAYSRLLSSLNIRYDLKIDDEKSISNDLFESKKLTKEIEAKQSDIESQSNKIKQPANLFKSPMVLVGLISGMIGVAITIPAALGWMFPYYMPIIGLLAGFISAEREKANSIGTGARAGLVAGAVSSTVSTVFAYLYLAIFLSGNTDILLWLFVAALIVIFSFISGVSTALLRMLLLSFLKNRDK